MTEKKRGEKLQRNASIPAHLLIGKKAVGNTNEEVMTNADMNWTAAKGPVISPKTGENLPPKFQRVYREDNDHTLGMVGKNYHILQPAEMFSIADSLVGDGLAEWSRVGQVGHGEKMYALLDLPEHITIGDNDQHDAKLYLSNTMDGSGSVRVYPTLERLFCRNQTSAFNRNLQKMGFSPSDLTIRHSSRMHEKIGDLKNALNLSNQMIDIWANQAEEMLDITMEFKDRETFYIEAFNMKPQKELVHKVDNPLGLPTQSRRRLEALAELETSQTNTVGGMADTPFQAFNVLTEYIDHATPVRADGTVKVTTAENTIFGAGGRTKQNAWARLVDAHL